MKSPDSVVKEKESEDAECKKYTSNANKSIVFFKENRIIPIGIHLK